jgi:hypothetical protein
MSFRQSADPGLRGADGLGGQRRAARWCCAGFDPDRIRLTLGLLITAGLVWVSVTEFKTLGGVSPMDPFIYVAVAASAHRLARRFVRPARRATRVDPMIAARQ